MFDIGEYIIYGKNGVCRLVDIGGSPFDENDTRTYYVLKPLGSNGVIYTPVDNSSIASRKLMKKSEIEELIKKIPSICELTVENEKNRREIYKSAVAELTPEGYVSVIKTVRGRRLAFENLRRHITETDAEYESLAKKSLYSEISVVMGIPFDEIENFIAEKIAKLQKA